MKKRIPIPRDRANNAAYSENNDDILRIEDYFDLSKLTEKDVRLVSNDIRVFIPHTFDEILSDEGEILIKESTYLTLPVNQVKKELKKLGFLDWQIKSEIRANKVKIIILYADIDKNTDIVVNKMLTCGWSKARISKPQYIYGTLFRVMDFDPIEQDPLTKEARFHKYLYHLTPHHNVDSILQITHPDHDRANIPKNAWPPETAYLRHASQGQFSGKPAVPENVMRCDMECVSGSASAGY